MSLLDTVRSAAQTAKNVTVDLWQDITYTVKSNRSYNPATGLVAETGTNYSVKALVTMYETAELGPHVESTDLKAMILQSELSVTPKKDDTVTYNGRDFNIIDFDRDVSNSFWYLQLR